MSPDFSAGSEVMPIEMVFPAGPEGFQVMSNSFQVTDQMGMVLFKASPSQVIVGAHTLKVTGQLPAPPPLSQNPGLPQQRSRAHATQM